MSVHTLTEKQQRRRANERREKCARNRRAKAWGRKPIRDKEYLDWIRKQPCAVCLKKCGASLVQVMQQYPTEAAHVGLIRGLGQKSSDREVIPLCAGHHRIYSDSHHHQQKLFWTLHALDRGGLIKAYNHKYETEHGQ